MSRLARGPRAEPPPRVERYRNLRRRRRSRPRPSLPPKPNITSPTPGATTRTEGASAKPLSTELCAEAEKRGIAIIRDKTAMRYGDRISKFMKRHGQGDRIFIVLSDKYLKSAYCMQRAVRRMAQLQGRPRGVHCPHPCLCIALR